MKGRRASEEPRLRVVLPNINAAYARHELSESERALWIEDYEHLSGKARWWTGRDPSLRIRHDSRAAATKPAEAEGEIAVPFNTFDLTADLLASPEPLRRLIDAGRDARTLTLDHWIATPTVAALAAELESNGVDVRPTSAELVRSAALVATMQSRASHDRLLKEICAGVVDVPSFIVAESWDEARRLLADGSVALPAVVKSDDSVGGNGVLFVHDRARADHLARRTAEEICANHDAYLRLRPPFVIERFCGAPEENDSPTADVVDDVDGATRCFVGEQILYGGGVYLGVHTGIPNRATHRVEAVARRLWAELKRRGASLNCNFDFVYRGDSLWLIEINLRKSSPYDHFLRAEHDRTFRLSLDFVPSDAARRLTALAPSFGVEAHARLSPDGSPTWTGLMISGAPKDVAAVATKAALDLPPRLLARIKEGHFP